MSLGVSPLNTPSVAPTPQQNGDASHGLLSRQVNHSTDTFGKAQVTALSHQQSEKSNSTYDVFLDSPLRLMGFLNEIAAAGVDNFKITLNKYIKSPFESLLKNVKEDHWLKAGKLKQKTATIDGRKMLVFENPKVREALKDGIYQERYFLKSQSHIASKKGFLDKMIHQGGLNLHKGQGLVTLLLWAPAIGYALAHAASKASQAYKASKNNDETGSSAFKKGLAAFGDYSIFHAGATVIVPAMIIHKTQGIVKNLFYQTFNVSNKTHHLSATKNPYVRLGLVAVGLGMIPLIIKVLDPVVQQLLDVAYRPFVNRPTHFNKNHESQEALHEIKENLSDIRPLQRSGAHPAALKLDEPRKKTAAFVSTPNTDPPVYLEPLSKPVPLTAQQTNFSPLVTAIDLDNYQVTPYHAQAIFERFI